MRSAEEKDSKNGGEVVEEADSKKGEMEKGDLSQLDDEKNNDVISGGG